MIDSIMNTPSMHNSQYVTGITLIIIGLSIDLKNEKKKEWLDNQSEWLENRADYRSAFW